jgi:alpha-tubulin suppressor-like RCC1 family protein
MLPATTLLLVLAIFFITALATSFNPPGLATKITTSPGIAAGKRHTCAIVDSTGHAQCWGDSGQMATPPDTTTSYAAISAGDVHSCALIRNTGIARCWGDNQDGQATPPDATTAYAAISTSTTHTCAIERDTYLVHCWGSNSNGQATPPDTTTKYSAVSAGDYHTCGIEMDTNFALCWGDNRFKPPNSAMQFSAISAGHQHVCAIELETSLLHCWGINTCSSATQQGFPACNKATPPDDGTMYFAISAGWDHTCALVKGTGLARCWGWNQYDRLAPPDSTTVYSAISAGGYQTCAIVSDTGIAQCWGDSRNSRGVAPDTTTRYLSDYVLVSRDYEGFVRDRVTGRTKQDTDEHGFARELPMGPDHIEHSARSLRSARSLHSASSSVVANLSLSGGVPGSIVGNLTSGDVVAQPMGSPVYTSEGHVRFDGVDDYLDLGWVNVVKPFSIAAWVKPDESSAEHQRVFDFFNSANGIDDIFLSRSYATTQCRMRVSGYGRNGGTTWDTSPDGCWSVRTWFHIAMTVDDSGIILYKNGKNIAERVYSTTDPIPPSMRRGYIGKSSYSSDALFKGSMADIKLLDVAVTAADMAHMYSGNKCQCFQKYGFNF